MARRSADPSLASSLRMTKQKQSAHHSAFILQPSAFILRLSAFIRRSSERPPRSRQCVFHEHAAGRDLLANAVSGRKIARAASGGAGGEPLLYPGGELGVDSVVLFARGKGK